MREWGIRLWTDSVDEPRSSQPTGVVETLAKQEGLETQLGGLERDAGRITSATEIADRLVLDPGDVHVGEIARAQQTAISTASRRSVFTLSPGLLGINDGATTRQSRPLPVR